MENNYNENNTMENTPKEDSSPVGSSNENASPSDENTPSGSSYHYTGDQLISDSGESASVNKTEVSPGESAEHDDGPSWSDPSYKQAGEDDFVYSPSYYGEKKGYESYQPPKSGQHKKESSFLSRRGIAFIVVCAIVCSLFSGVASLLVVNYKLDNAGYNRQVVLGATSSGDSNQDSQSVQYTGEELTGSQIYNLALTQVVGVNSGRTTTNIFGQETSSVVSGSGFVISEDGYILTNYHVIEYADRYGYDLSVMFSDGTEYAASIVGYDESNDVAVIKIDASGLNPVAFADSDSMSVGDTIYLVGNPLGELTYSMSSGIISATNRMIATDAATEINMFQVDAAVNEGNSGGPVYNQYGEVLGIVTAKYTDTGVEGLGFAIPINDVLDMVTQLIENGYITGQAQLGVTVQTVTSSFSQYFSVPDGAYVREVQSGSCAEKAGVLVSDIIVGVDDTTITSKEDLTSYLRQCEAGDTVTLKVHRSGQTIELSVTLDQKIPTDSSQG